MVEEGRCSAMLPRSPRRPEDVFPWLLELLLAVSPRLSVLCRSAAAKESHPSLGHVPCPGQPVLIREPSPFFQLGTTLKGQLQSTPWSQRRLLSQSCFSFCPVLLPSPGSDPRSICWSLSQSKNPTCYCL